MLMYCFRIIELSNKNIMRLPISTHFNRLTVRYNQHYTNTAHMCFLFQPIFTTNFKICICIKC